MTDRNQALLKQLALPSRVLSIACLLFAVAMIALVLVIGLAPIGEVTVFSRDGAVEDFDIAFSQSVTAGTVIAPQAQPSVVAVKDLKAPARIALFGWAAFPTAFLIWGLFGARRCFQGLAAGRYYARETVLGLRTFALGVFLYQLAQPLAKMAAAPFLPIPSGARALRVEFAVSGDASIILIFAGVVMLVSHALARAADIADENEQFV